MKKMKKFLSVLLASAMTLAMAAPGFAANGTSVGDETNGSITIDNAKATEEGYKAYKIFDVTYNGANYAYSIDNNGSDLLGLIQGFATEGSGLKLTPSADGKSYVVEFTQGVFAVADFAKELSENTGKLGEPTELKYNAATEEASASGLQLGYYFVTTGTGALCNLTTTEPSITIHDKNDMPFEKTVTEDASVQIGQILHYEVKGMVPDTLNLERFVYTVTDHMSPGLTFNKDVKIEIGTGAPTEPTSINYSEDYEYDFDGDKVAYHDNGFDLYVDVNKLNGNNNAKYGQEIRITYTATVNDNAVTKISENEAKLTYTNGYDTKTDSTPKTVEVYSSKIEISKYTLGENDAKTPLADAEFVLYRKGKEENADEDLNKNYYYKYTAAAGDAGARVEWIDEDTWKALEDAEKYSDSYVKKTGADGKASFDGLQAGTYYLLETKAPAGYNLLDKAEEVIVNRLDLSNKPADEAAVVVALTTPKEVENKAGAILPGTGGIGTTIFYAAGIILMAGAVFFVVRRKRA